MSTFLAVRYSTLFDREEYGGIDGCSVSLLDSGCSSTKVELV